MKRLTCALLTVVLLCVLLPVSAEETESGWTFEDSGRGQTCTVLGMPAAW